MTRDAEHLDLLAVFHYVVAGLGALCSFIPGIHLTIGLGLASGQLEGAEDPVAQKVGLVMALFAGLLILLGLIFSFLVFLAGRKLRRRTSYMFCLVIAGLLCVFMPFGTVLGVFTIIVLMRESVRELFGEAAPAAEA